MRSGGEGGGDAPDGKARVDVMASPLQIKAAAGEVSPEIVQQKTSSPKRRLAESECSAAFEGDLKRTRLLSTMDDDLSCKDSIMGTSLVHAVDVPDLYKDVVTMKTNLALATRDNDFVKELVSRRSRQNDVIAESPKEAFALSKALKSFTKFKNSTEKQLERREISALIRDIRADHRDVRADHRDVRADHRDLRADQRDFLAQQTKQTLAEAKRQADLCFERYLAFVSSTGTADKSSSEEDEPTSSSEGDEPKSRSEGDDPKSRPEGDGPKSRPEGDEPKSRPEGDEPKSRLEGDERKSRLEGDEPKSRPEEVKPKSSKPEKEPKSGFVAAITQRLDSAESAIKLSEKAVELGEKAAAVTTRAEKLGETVNKSKTLKFLLSGVVSSACAYARQALKEWNDGDEPDVGADLG